MVIVALWAMADAHGGGRAAVEPLWRTVAQPLGLNLLVLALGVALIAWELWWFLGSHGAAEAARLGDQGIQEISITVDGGYLPARVQALAGRPLRLSFHRIDPSGCLAQVIFPDFHKSLDLPLNRTTTIELPAAAPGTYAFHCGMNMVRGVLVLNANSTVSTAARPMR